MLAGGGDFAAGNLELDFARHQHGGDDGARRIRRPSERVATEIIEQAFAIDGAALVDVIPKADHRLVISLERGATGDRLHQAEGIKGAANGCRVGDLEEFLGGIRRNTNRSFDIAIKHLLVVAGSDQFDQGLDGAVIAREAGDGAAGLHLDAAGDGHRSLQTDTRQGVESLTQGVVENPFHIDCAQGNGAALLLDIAQSLAEEDETAILLAERDMHIDQHLFDRSAHRVEQRGRGDRGVHQAGDVLHGDRQVAQDLQDRDRSRDVLMKLRVGEADLDLADGLMNGREGAADVLFQLVIEGDGGGEPAHGLVGHRLRAAFALEHILNHLDCRAQANAAGGLGDKP
ncbi:MAG: hypothetical protein V5B33_04005 [Candidatus Accumulibacter sp. UW20]